MALSTKQIAFVEFYLTHWNATKAAILAGYSERSARSIGSENLTKPDIQAAIQERLTELKMGADEVLTRLSDHARGSIAVFIDISEPDAKIEAPETMDEAHAVYSGWRLNLAKAKKADKLHLIKKLKSGQWGPEIELHDPQAALIQIGKHHKLFVDKVEHTGADGQPLFKVYEKTDAFDPNDA
jgi:phage terminase small subunit